MDASGAEKKFFFRRHLENPKGAAEGRKWEGVGYSDLSD